jgi:hypothetical protein
MGFPLRRPEATRVVLVPSEAMTLVDALPDLSSVGVAPAGLSDDTKVPTLRRG